MGWHPNYVFLEWQRKSTSTGCSLNEPFLLKFSKKTEQGTDYSEAFENNKMKKKFNNLQTARYFPFDRRDTSR